MTALTPREARLLGYMEPAASGCWEWTGARNESGYGVAWDGARTRLAHREAWVEWRGPIPAGLSVLHQCDNPPCINPDHLFLGTHADNMRDAAAKGRLGVQARPETRPRGTQHHAARLTEADVTAIREHRAAGARLSAIAKAFGISEAHASRIVRREGWTHV